ncbi:MAG TPA: Na(+)/H(+) antiporter subunit B [Syntrophomonadaceae bacterium]|jgi:multicomponent Na+:H+ antiporter subunit B|nr:Na(+)/H(+) antiporter subunit B [Syntrophomonadaceae bacterium]
MKKSNDVILRTVTKFASAIIFTFAINLFFSGHHNPGGGFIGGLAFASGLTLLLLSYDIDSVTANMPLDFRVLGAVGVLLAVLTGVAAMVTGGPFLTQTFGHINLPVFGTTEIATAVVFDIGVALAVIGTAVTIIMSIGNDR